MMAFLGNQYLVCTFVRKWQWELWELITLTGNFGWFLPGRWDWACPRCWTLRAWDSLLLLFPERKTYGLQYRPGRVPRHCFVTLLTLEKREYATFSTATTHGFSLNRLPCVITIAVVLAELYCLLWITKGCSARDSNYIWGHPLGLRHAWSSFKPNWISCPCRYNQIHFSDSCTDILFNVVTVKPLNHLLNISLTLQCPNVKKLGKMLKLQRCWK